MSLDADVIIVGGGLAGLVAAAELTEARRLVILVDQEPEQSLGGQAFWSLGGLFLVGSPEQRRLGIRDSFDRFGAGDATAQTMRRGPLRTGQIGLSATSQAQMLRRGRGVLT